MFKKRRKEEKNLLNMVPLLEKRVTLTKESNGAFLIIQRTNIVERFTIRFFRQPAVRRIKLDKFGLFVIEQLDDHKNVQQIAEEMSEHFGEEADPALPRLVKFLQVLEVYDWIIWEIDDPVLK